MKKLLFAAIALCVLLFLWASDAFAHPIKCGDRVKLIEHLKSKYGETISAMSLSQSSKITFEFFRSEEGSWTIVTTQTNGLTCVFAGGHSWRDIPKNPNDLKPLGKPT